MQGERKPMVAVSTTTMVLPPRREAERGRFVSVAARRGDRQVMARTRRGIRTFNVTRGGARSGLLDVEVNEQFEAHETQPIAHEAQPRTSAAREAQPSAHEAQPSASVAHEAQPSASTGGTVNQENNANKKRRGPTYMTSIWGRPRGKGLLKIGKNKLGLPIGEHRKSLVAFLGTIARNPLYCPIDYRSWHSIPDSKKVAMVEKVKERFDLLDGADGWIKSSIAVKWRNWKHKLKSEWYDPYCSIQGSITCLDERVDQSQWTKLVEFWESEESKKQNLGHSPSRAEMFEHCYTDSSRNPSNAEVSNILNEMREKRSQLPPDSTDELGPSDIFAQVMGPERNGRVRMCGEGVSPSDVWGELPSCRGAQRIIAEQGAALKRLEAEIVEMRVDLCAVLPRMSNNSTHKSRPTSSECFNNNTLRVNAFVSLLSITDPNKVVAKARISSMDPNRMVEQTILGEGWCEVVVLEPIHLEEKLIRPYSLIQTIQDADGTPIVWPLTLVRRIQED